MLTFAAWIAWLFVLPSAVHLKGEVLLLPHPPKKSESPSLEWGLSSRLFANAEDYEDSSRLPFRTHLKGLGLSKDSCDVIVDKLMEVNLLENTDCSAETLLLLAVDFIERPEVFSSLLISDFGLTPLLAHQTRAATMILLRNGRNTSSLELAKRGNQQFDDDEAPLPAKVPPRSIEEELADAVNNQPDTIPPTAEVQEMKETSSNVTELQEDKKKNPESTKRATHRPAFKSVVVNRQAKLRKGKQSSSGDSDHEYGLPSDYQIRFPTIASELEEFYSFMTRPTTASQESPIREATANVYLRHARLFLGYHAKINNITEEDHTDDDDDDDDDGGKFSLYNLFPTKEKESADPVLDFILWLRSSRKISVSYEANLLRGLTKLLKFRFAGESKNDPTYGEKSFDDIPLIRELRMLHREADKKQRLAPRSSDEKQKWLSWPEYLQVVSLIQSELAALIEEYDTMDHPEEEEDSSNKMQVCSKLRRKIAGLYQKYLVLAIFASVPDRQRTIRELVVGGNFQKDEDNGCWCIRHAPEDYKTGNAYGERPPLQLAQTLTPEIDDFLDRWRRCLSPLSDTLFVQPRTGKPLTQDSVYQIVSRCCYNYMGKRTNPHLLRDMLVTHVRESDASEKELEALALYMGHSIAMQRTSYDRRTLTKKVAPAVKLMQHVNGAKHNNG